MASPTHPFKNFLFGTASRVAFSIVAAVLLLATCIGLALSSLGSQSTDFGLHQKVSAASTLRLGEFIEVEKMTEEVDGEKIQEELFQFLETLGVSRSDRALHGYDVLLNQKKNQTS
jgi:hypothetical protein